MQACLDPRVPVLSPALEGRVLTGFALASISAVFLTTIGEVPTTDMVSTGIFDGIDGTLLDGIVGGAAAFFGGIGESADISEAEGILEGIDGTLLDTVMSNTAAFFGGIGGETNIAEAEEELMTGGAVAVTANYIGQVVIPYLIRIIPFL